MIVLFCPDERRLHQLAATIPTEHRTLATTARDECLHETPAADCLVAGVLDGSDADLATWLCERPAINLVPTVLVMPRDAELLRLFVTASPTEVVWWHDVRRELGPVVRRAIGTTLLGRVADAIEACDEVPARLRAALAAACRASPPIRSVGRLTSVADRSARRLQELWRRIVDDPDYRLKDFLNWLLLLQATLTIENAESSDDCLRLIGRSPRTMERISRRLAGRTFAQLQRTRPIEIAETFRRKAVAPIIHDLSD